MLSASRATLAVCRAAGRQGSCASGVCARAHLHTTALALKLFQLPVPKMGDSITEGTLLKLLKSPGEAVALDEIVAVIETDKVTVDVRASEAGVVKSVHAKAQDTVAVGALLLTLDSAGAPFVGSSAAAPAAAVAAAPPAPPAAPAAPAAPVASPPSAAQEGAHRKPSIHFRHGKRDEGAGTGHSSSGSTGATPPEPPPRAGDYAAAVSALFPSKATRSYYDLPAMYGRPRFTAAEMFAVDSGGCEYVPEPPKDDKGKKGKK